MTFGVPSETLHAHPHGFNMSATCQNNRHSRRLEFVVTGFILLLLGGCHFCPQWPFLSRRSIVEYTPAPEPTYSVFSSPLFVANRPRRILLLESGQTPGKYGETQILITELAAQLRSAGSFDVVAPPGDRLHVHSDNILQGQFDEREIARLSRRYNVDAIALVKVNEFRAYSPMQAGVTMAIVSSNESVVTFAVDGTWDANRPATQAEFRRYVCASCNLPSSSNESQSIYLQSPTRFLSLIASQITDALNSRVR